MASFDLTGRLIEKYDTVQRTATFQTREFVVEVSEDGANGRTFTNFVKFQCVQDRTAIADNANIGDQVKVTFNVRGTKWEKDGRTNYITNLDAWRLEKIVTAAASGSAQDYTDMPPVIAPSSADDDLPF